MSSLSFDKIISNAYDELLRDVGASAIVIRSAGTSVINDTKRKLEELIGDIDVFQEKIDSLLESYKDSGDITLGNSISGNRKKDERKKKSFSKPKLPPLKASMTKQMKYADRNFLITEQYRKFVTDLLDIEERLSKIPKKSIKSIIPKIREARTKFNVVFKNARKALEEIAKNIVPKNLNNMGNYVKRIITKKSLQKQVSVKRERAIVKTPDDKKVICVYYVIIEDALNLNGDDVDIFISLWCTADLKTMSISEVKMRIDDKYVSPLSLKTELNVKPKDRAKVIQFIDRDLARLNISLLKQIDIKVDKTEFDKMGFIGDNISVKGSSIIVNESAADCIKNPKDRVRDWKFKDNYIVNLYVAAMKAAGIEPSRNPLKSVGRVLLRLPKFNKARNEVTFTIQILPIGWSKEEVKEFHIKRLRLAKKDLKFDRGMKMKLSSKIGTRISR